MSLNMPPNPFEWKNFIDVLREQKCVLFLGPHVFQEDNRTLDALLKENIQDDPFYKKNIELYSEEDGLFFFPKKRHRSWLVDKIRTFYEQDFPDNHGFLRKLTEIPFSLVVSLSPHDLIQRAMKANGFFYKKDFYHKNEPPTKDFFTPNKEIPLLYNYMGDLEYNESLILTHNDLFDYIKSSFDERYMHNDLKALFHNAECYLFLGLPLDRWYMQLLLRTLSLHESKLADIERFATQSLSTFQVRLYKDQFKLEFVPYRVREFIDQLYYHAKKEKVLKIPIPSKKEQKIKFSPEDLRSELGKGKILIVLMSLRQLNIQRFQPAIDSLIIQYEILEKNNISGVVENFEIKRNQKINLILKLIRQIEDYLKDK